MVAFSSRGSVRASFLSALILPVMATCFAGSALSEEAGKTDEPAKSDQPAAAEAPKTGRSFFDAFDFRNPNRWVISHGWSNGEHQACTWTKSNVHFKDGSLTLSLTDEPSKERSYSCAEIRTKEAFGYGTYEVGMRAGAGSGMVSAFFTYIGKPYGADLPHDEIDFEFLGKDRKAVDLNYFVNGDGSHGHKEAFEFDVTETTNRYAFEWLPDRLRWFANGKLIREVKGSPAQPLPSHPGKIFLSIWAGQGKNMEGWLGPLQYPGAPVTASYDFVAFTEGGAPCQFPESIVCTQEEAAKTGK